MCFAQTEARLSKRCSCNGRRRPRVARHLQARLETRLETRRETRLERVARHFQARRSTGWRRVPLAPPILAHVMAHAQCERARLAPASARPAPRAAVTGRNARVPSHAASSLARRAPSAFCRMFWCLMLMTVLDTASYISRSPCNPASTSADHTSMYMPQPHCVSSKSAPF